MSDTSLWKKIIYFPISKIIAGLVICLGAAAFISFLTRALFENIALGENLEQLISAILLALIVIIAYKLLYARYEQRTISELSTDKMWNWLLYGILIGVALQTLTILVIALTGGFKIISTQSILLLAIPLTMAISSSVVEEVIFRGIIFRIMEEKLGTYIALAISALIFGALHLGNPNSSLIYGLGLAIQAGILLGASYVFARNLWFPIAIHFAWNFTQSGIFGANTSGHNLNGSLLQTEITGADWITGGSFGPEGSIQATIFCLLVAIYLLKRSHQEGKLIKPFWKKEKA